MGDMIDFRFHLVSIVSIFLALAVGIVLGAGPLQGSIGTQLTDQVSQLRQEKDTLRAQLNDANTSVGSQNDYAAVVAAAALGGRLEGKGVVLVVSSDTGGKFANEVQQSLAQAGASVTTVVTLKDDYRDPAAALTRLTVAKKAAQRLGLASTDNADTLVADVIGRVLVHTVGTADTPLPDGAQALGDLKSAGLLDYSQSTLRRADDVVMLGGPISGTAASVKAQTTTLLALARAVDSGSSGLVVASGAPTTGVGQDVTTNLVTAIRQDKEVASVISTVDHADSTIGSAVVVLAAVRESAGTSGHYGISPDAQATVPASSPPSWPVRSSTVGLLSGRPGGPARTMPATRLPCSRGHRSRSGPRWPRSPAALRSRRSAHSSRVGSARSMTSPGTTRTRACADTSAPSGTARSRRGS